MNDDAYETLRRRLAAMLKRDALLQTLGQHAKIGANFPETRSRLETGGDQRHHKLVVATKFWDAWIMARNMDWIGARAPARRRWAAARGHRRGRELRIEVPARGLLSIAAMAGTVDRAALAGRTGAGGSDTGSFGSRGTSSCVS
ncbi:MAG: hypothetical protein HY749_17820 [Gammaproteobacteria bacterium]|nr:hypothetical protein [Gammaproteobacteria bacterium]MBI5618175.1 hypothetical protein [Gammaproteobacteria bacterium]